MGGGEGEGVGCLEIAFTFQAGSSLHDALGVGQAVVVPHVKPCHVPRGNQSQQLNKPVSLGRKVPEAGQAGRAACMKVQWLLHRFPCLAVISGARL